MSIPMSANLTAEPSFTPRKEFLRIPVPPPDSFALLALSSANCIRLYSFPASVVDALRRLFQLSIVLSSREDLLQGLYEFTLDGKPWANPKAVSTEKLLLDILAIIYRCGYNYLSTIDYGRESDDRLAMVFSTPATSPNSKSANPLSPANSTSLSDEQRVQRVPFALSFLSATLMRVIAPPLHLTPAILQAVRASCPRGVVSEKKVGDNSFEFKLKGYKWFQQDTFATDSLRHILSLLSSLDSQSFSLLTSLSLSNRSRVKDLWIFTGLLPEDSLPVETTEPNTTVSNILRIPLQTASNHPIDVPKQHKRSATEPTANLPSAQYSRTATDGPQRPQNPIPSPQPHLLRKPTPRAQVPVSVFQDSNIPDEHHQILHAQIPSIISTGIDDMTGVGALGFKSASSPPSTPPPKIGGQVTHGRSGSDKVATSPLLTSTSPKQISQLNAKDEKLMPSTNDLSLPPLLGINAFRDTAFSLNPATPTALDRSYKKDAKLVQEPKLNLSYDSSGPRFPGSWQTTPVDWKVEEETGFSTSMSEGKSAPSTPIHENDCHIEAPAITAPDMSLRKSEAALIGMIASTSHVPPISQDEKSRKASENSLNSGGQGWVLVNVEGPSAVRSDESAGASNATTPRPHESKRPNSPLSTSVSASQTPKSPVPEQPSPAAKAIVIMDAIDPKKKKRSTMESKESSEGSSTGFKQFFSLNKKNSVRRGGKMKAEAEAESSALKSTSLLDRLRLSLRRTKRRQTALY